MLGADDGDMLMFRYDMFLNSIFYCIKKSDDQYK